MSSKNRPCFPGCLISLESLEGKNMLENVGYLNNWWSGPVWDLLEASRLRIVTCCLVWPVSTSPYICCLLLAHILARISWVIGVKTGRLRTPLEMINSRMQFLWTSFTGCQPLSTSRIHTTTFKSSKHSSYIHVRRPHFITKLVYVKRAQRALLTSKRNSLVLFIE